MPSKNAHRIGLQLWLQELRVRLSLELERWLDAIALIEIKFTPHNGERTHHVLVAGPGNGSIGDEAMYEAFASTVDGPLVVIARTPHDLLVDPAEFGARAEYLPGLLYGRTFSRLRDVRRLLRILSQSISLSVIGADTMDGLYGARPSVRRFRIATLSTKIGVPARILGFSWNTSPSSATLRQLKRTPHTVTLIARDPLSEARLRRDGAKTVVKAADLAFLVPRIEGAVDNALDNWFEQQAIGGRRVVILNANPRLRSKFIDQDIAYVSLLNEILSEGYSCLVLPHDSRNGTDSEVSYLNDLFSAYVEHDNVFVSKSVFLPSQVAELSSRCVLAVSGRMHLVILAAVGGTPGIGLDYQGKFEGLYEHFGFDLRVSSGSLLPRLSETVIATLSSADDLRDRLSVSMPKIREMAEANFDGLTTSQKLDSRD